jgi:hypothetical protein
MDFDQLSPKTPGTPGRKKGATKLKLLENFDNLNTKTKNSGLFSTPQRLAGRPVEEEEPS